MRSQLSANPTSTCALPKLSLLYVFKLTAGLRMESAKMNVKWFKKFTGKPIPLEKQLKFKLGKFYGF